MTQTAQAEYVAANILMLAQQGCRWRDMAVVVREAPESGVLEAAFRKFGIPVQMDSRGFLLDKPLAALLFSAIQVVTGGYACARRHGLSQDGAGGAEHG